MTGGSGKFKENKIRELSEELICDSLKNVISD